MRMARERPQAHPLRPMPGAEKPVIENVAVGAESPTRKNAPFARQSGTLPGKRGVFCAAKMLCCRQNLWRPFFLSAGIPAGEKECRLSSGAERFCKKVAWAVQAERRSISGNARSLLPKQKGAPSAKKMLRRKARCIEEKRRKKIREWFRQGRRAWPSGLRRCHGQPAVWLCGGAAPVRQTAAPQQE